MCSRAAPHYNCNVSVKGSLTADFKNHLQTESHVAARVLVLSPAVSCILEMLSCSSTTLHMSASCSNGNTDTRTLTRL